MACLECGCPNTCKAHILPAAIGKDIIRASDGRKALSIAIPERIDNTIQSGLFDGNILCAACDGKLGKYDDHVIEIARLVGTQNESRTRDNFFIHRGDGVNHEYLALFAAAVIWRTSVSTYRELAQFRLDIADQERFRSMAFRTTPDFPTVAIFRLVSENPIALEATTTAMSYPGRFLTADGHVRARFSIRGLLFLVQLGQAPDHFLQEHSVTTLGKSEGIEYLTGALFPFEELLKADNVRQTKYVKKILGS